MSPSPSLTSLTTITGFSHIPLLRVAQIVCALVRTLLRNSAGGHHQKSGDGGDSGERVSTDECFEVLGGEEAGSHDNP